VVPVLLAVLSESDSVQQHLCLIGSYDRINVEKKKKKSCNLLLLLTAAAKQYLLQEYVLLMDMQQ
jgi:hypothetical protein